MKIITSISLFAICLLAACSQPQTGNCPLTELQRDKDNTLYHIDFVNGQLVNDESRGPFNVSGEYLEIQGWAVDTKAGDVPENIHFQIGEKHFENTLITKRQDVANVLKMEKAVNAGYSFKIPLADVGEGTMDVDLIIIKKDNQGYYAPNPAKTIKINVADITAAAE